MRPERPDGKLRILIVDDEPQVATALADVLEDDYRVITETSAQAALDTLKADKRIAVILSDQRMPGMTGDELFAQARKVSIATRVLVTAYADIGAVIDAVNKGKIFGYITKPWQPDDIILTVNRAADYCSLNRRIFHEQALLRQLMESSVDAICIKDRAHRYVRLNAHEARILGAGSAVAAEGRTAAEFLPPERSEIRHADEVVVFRSGEPMRDRLEHVTTGEGRERWYAMNLAPIKDLQGETVGLVGITRDVTEAKKLDDLKDQFIATVRHELRTPLTAIRGALGLLRAGAAGALAKQAQRMVEIGYSNCGKLISLINDLLDAEMFGNEEPQFDMLPLPVCELVATAVEACEDQGRARQVAIRPRGTLPEREIKVDRSRLLQVLGKLIANAVEAAPPGSDVTVSAQVVEGDRVRISVVDRGAGVPADFHQGIFKKFSQVDSSDTRKKGGAGLGLYIAKSVIEGHGGRIDFNSVEGRGTEFFFELPLYHRPAQAMSRPAC